MRIEDAREEVATEDPRIACTTEELTQLMVKSAEVFEPLEVHNRGAGDPSPQSVPLATPFATADSNADGFVDFDDLLVLAAQYNTGP